MKVRDIMSVDVATTATSVGAQEAWEHMRVRGFHHLVVMRGSKVVGIVSERDFGDAGRGTSQRMGRAVGELMTRAPVTIGPGASIAESAELMLGRSIGCLPVMEGATVVGIITVADLLRQLIGASRPRKPKPRALTLRHHGRR